MQNVYNHAARCDSKANHVSRFLDNRSLCGVLCAVCACVRAYNAGRERANPARRAECEEISRFPTQSTAAEAAAVAAVVVASVVKNAWAPTQSSGHRNSPNIITICVHCARGLQWSNKCAWIAPEINAFRNLLSAHTHTHNHAHVCLYV